MQNLVISRSLSAMDGKLNVLKVKMQSCSAIVLLIKPFNLFSDVAVAVAAFCRHGFLKLLIYYYFGTNAVNKIVSRFAVHV